MAVVIKKIGKASAVLGAFAVVVELWTNNGLLMGAVYTGVSLAAAPVIVREVISLHNRAQQRLADDRQQNTNHDPPRRRVADQAAAPGEMPAYSSNPEMAGPLERQLAMRMSFLARYERDPASATHVVSHLDRLIAHDRQIADSYNGIDSKPIHDKLADLRIIDTRLSALRSRIVTAPGHASQRSGVVTQLPSGDAEPGTISTLAY